MIKIGPKCKLNEGIKLSLTYQLLNLHIWEKKKEEKKVTKGHMSTDPLVKHYALQNQPQF